ncbi:hypothetical protein [Streptomyces sp. NPDC055709]
MTTDQKISVITKPPFLTADAGDATLTISLFNPTTNTITLTLPIGDADTDLIATNKAGNISAPELTGDTKWNVSSAKATSSSSYTCVISGSTTPQFLLLTLRNVPINSKPGTAVIQATGGITDTYTLPKYPNEFTLQNFTANPPTIKNGQSVNLSWKSTNAKQLDLMYGQGQTERLQGSSQTVAGIHEPTTFRLQATTTGDVTAALTTNVQVTEPDLILRTLTTKKLTTPPIQKNSPQQYFLPKEEPLSLTAPSDGCYTIEFQRNSRLLGKFPITTTQKSTGLCEIQLQSEDSTSTFVQKEARGEPLAIFASKGTKLTLTQKKSTEVDFFSTLAGVEVTWSGSNPSSAAPPSSSLPSAYLPISPTNTYGIVNHDTLIGDHWPYSSFGQFFAVINDREIGYSADYHGVNVSNATVTHRMSGRISFPEPIDYIQAFKGEWTFGMAIFGSTQYRCIELFSGDIGLGRSSVIPLVDWSKTTESMLNETRSGYYVVTSGAKRDAPDLHVIGWDQVAETPYDWPFYWSRGYKVGFPGGGYMDKDGFHDVDFTSQINAGRNPILTEWKRVQ